MFFTIMAECDKNSRQSLLEDMKATAHNGDLAQLQCQLAEWDAEIIDSQKDSLWYRPTVLSEFEVFNEMNRPREETKRISTSWHISHELLVAASRGNQAAVVKFMVTERDCSITSGAVEQAMKAKAFHVLEVFLEHGWDINQPIRNNLCPILR